MHRQGWTVAAIAAQVGRSRRTIERYLHLPMWPVRQHRRHYGRSILNPYQAYLLERWNAGCHTAIQLFHELQARGYTGSYRRVTASVSRIRQAQGIPPRRQGRRQRLPARGALGRLLLGTRGRGGRWHGDRQRPIGERNRLLA